MLWHSPAVNAPKSYWLIAGNPGNSSEPRSSSARAGRPRPTGPSARPARRCGPSSRRIAASCAATWTWLATFVCVSSVETLAHGAVLHRPELLADGRVGVLHRRSGPAGDPVPHLGRQIAAAGVVAAERPAGWMRLHLGDGPQGADNSVSAVWEATHPCGLVVGMRRPTTPRCPRPPVDSA